MGIGPIPALPPVAPVSRSNSAPELTGVFAVEFRHQDRDDSYSPSQKASRGLEDENNDNETLDTDPAGNSDASPTKISFFA
jgi:hypothetical protein